MKKLLVGLMVAFVMAAVLPLAAQAQGTVASNCKYVGPADPLALTTTVTGLGVIFPLIVKTTKSEKEIFYCYKTPKDVPDDKTLADPIANRDRITKNLNKIVEIEIFAYLGEQFIFDGEDGTLDIFAAGFRAVRCVKELVTAGSGSTTLDTWVVKECTTFSRSDFPDLMELNSLGLDEFLPQIPSTAARRCGSFGKSPYTGGPIHVEDPTEMNTVTISPPLFGEGGLFIPLFGKTVKVNKEVFRCFHSGSPNIPVIYDVQIYFEELDALGQTIFALPLFVAYCAKNEKEAILMGCSFKGIGEVPFVEQASQETHLVIRLAKTGQGWQIVSGPSGLTTASSGLLLQQLRPFVSLKSVELKQSAGQYVFEAQGYNIEGVQVQVYNLSGKQVFSAETGGTQLSWNGLSSDGRRLANGVYLYVMTVKGTYGDLVQTKVQKLAILR